MIPPTFADRAIRAAFRHPDNLREFLERVCPGLPEGADYAGAEHLDREFYLEDLEKREPDLVIKVPVRGAAPDAAPEFFLIIEHQSRAQRRIAYRIAQYCTMLWRQRLRFDPNPSPFCLPPVIPILLHTHPPAWPSPVPLESLIKPLAGAGAGAALPLRFGFHYLDVPALDREELLSSDRPFDLYLSVLPIGPSTPDLCLEVLSRALVRLEQLMISRARFMDLVHSMLQWTYARQDGKHRNRIIQTAAEQLSPENRSLTVSIHESVAKSLDDELIESCARSFAEGEARGEARGEAQGEAKGALEASHANLLTVLQSRFGELPRALVQEIEVEQNLDRLGLALVAAATVLSLDEFSL